MRPATLRLESFAPAGTGPQITAHAAELEHAYQLGHEKGLADGRELSLDALCTKLSELQDRLVTSATDRSELLRETSAALQPVLEAVTGLLAAAHGRERILACLRSELDRISRDPIPHQLRICCPADMIADIRECVERSGLANASIEAADLGPDAIEILFQGGAIQLDPDRVTRECQAIIDELAGD
ncbi:hypothetical protein RGQ15_05015 [Paracoccus sp. MBLB3053]|uniref:Flagellar assembly protein FliH/Type III secretion system HrpE domain-containing protein n=1 Tax=Paracoccus aurantius TaxID=3073814 RepID=A0ABU2HPG4_9RHOB|nr:hypothetical protein [Paracoccus sp. MBLB3053]MDS9466938.1 hypothetical protein [Paracoccus sp. MBLB3053]